MAENDVLKKIYAAKAQHLEDEMAREPYGVIRERAKASVQQRRPFVEALKEQRGNALVTEIKRASPSAGLIARDFNAVAIAERYERAGADAISILTESDHFLGDINYVPQVRAKTKLPLLRKDFISHPYQVAQSAAYGADCILLIVGGLRDEQIRACLAEAKEYDLDVLVEVHDVKNLNRALEFDVTFIGVNNRNLRTMITDLAVGEHILPQVPKGVFAISESGVANQSDIERLRKAGAKGFLIGEALMRAEDPEELIASLKRVYAH
jgi:indole-3-glycerol phosphate synthase